MRLRMNEVSQDERIYFQKDIFWSEMINMYMIEPTYPWRDQTTPDSFPNRAKSALLHIISCFDAYFPLIRLLISKMTFVFVPKIIIFKVTKYH